MRGCLPDHITGRVIGRSSVSNDNSHGEPLVSSLPSSRRLLLFLFGLLSACIGEAYGQVPLTSLLADAHASLQWNGPLDEGVIISGDNVFSFSPGMTWGILDYSRRVDTGRITRGANGEILFTNVGAESIRTALDSSDPAAEVTVAPPDEGASPGASGADQATASVERARIAAIIIDPGHGGKDPGTMQDPFDRRHLTTPLEEKNIVLQVGLDVYHELQKKYPDKKIVITRDRDVYVSLERRSEIANSIKLAPGEAKIFVSIHANASFDHAARGYEVWYLPPSYQRDLVNPKSVGTDSKALLPILNNMREQEYETESILLGKDILGGIHGAIGTDEVDRGLKSNDWFVVRNSKMPAVLVEVGFVSNPDEAKLLADPSYLAKLADGIAAGISNFVTFFDRKSGFVG
jgi:N-acetylmuramoyl-L-alanine amidase